MNLSFFIASSNLIAFLETIYICAIVLIIPKIVAVILVTLQHHYLIIKKRSVTL
jgi:hypothetical protein